MSLLSSLIATLFARVLVSFIHWLLVFFKTSLAICFIAAMFAMIFESYMNPTFVF